VAQWVGKRGDRRHALVDDGVVVGVVGRRRGLVVLHLEDVLEPAAAAALDGQAEDEVVVLRRRPQLLDALKREGKA